MNGSENGGSINPKLYIVARTALDRAKNKLI